MDTAIVFYFLSLNGTSRLEVAEGFTHTLSPQDKFSFSVFCCFFFLFFFFPSNMFLTLPGLLQQAPGFCSS